MQCLATAYEQSGGSNAVVKGFKELVAKYPNGRSYRLELAKAYERKEDMAGAFRAWKHVLEMNPGDAGAERGSQIQESLLEDVLQFLQRTLPSQFRQQRNLATLLIGLQHSQ